MNSNQPIGTCQKGEERKISFNYIRDLFRERNLIALLYPKLLKITGNLIEKEIESVRAIFFEKYGINKSFESSLPEPLGRKRNFQEKLYINEESNQNFNAVGHLLGPDGTTAKYVQECFGVTIMIRGKGSVRDRKHELANFGKPNWEHLNEQLHIIIAAEDSENRVQLRVNSATECIKKFIQSKPDEDIKQVQLLEVASSRDLAHRQFVAKFQSNYLHNGHHDVMGTNLSLCARPATLNSPSYDRLQCSTFNMPIQPWHEYQSSDTELYRVSRSIKKPGPLLLINQNDHAQCSDSNTVIDLINGYSEIENNAIYPQQIENSSLHGQSHENYAQCSAMNIGAIRYGAQYLSQPINGYNIISSIGANELGFFNQAYQYSKQNINQITSNPNVTTLCNFNTMRYALNEVNTQQVNVANRRHSKRNKNMRKIRFSNENPEDGQDFTNDLKSRI